MSERWQRLAVVVALVVVVIAFAAFMADTTDDAEGNADDYARCIATGGTPESCD